MSFVRCSFRQLLKCLGTFRAHLEKCVFLRRCDVWIIGCWKELSWCYVMVVNSSTPVVRYQGFLGGAGRMEIAVDRCWQKHKSKAPKFFRRRIRRVTFLLLHHLRRFSHHPEAVMPTTPIPLFNTVEEIYTATSYLTQAKRWDTFFSAFEKEYEGTPVQFVSRAPGRVNIIGEHIDYCGL